MKKLLQLLLTFQISILDNWLQLGFIFQKLDMYSSNIPYQGKTNHFVLNLIVFRITYAAGAHKVMELKLFPAKTESYLEINFRNKEYVYYKLLKKDGGTRHYDDIRRPFLLHKQPSPVKA